MGPSVLSRLILKEVVVHTAIVMLGGAIGAACRYWASFFVAARTTSDFPLGTLVVNAAGSLCIGVLWYIMSQESTSTGLRLFLIVGVLGGFTTFSAFSMETLNLLRAGDLKMALINIVASNVVCLVMAAIGFYASKLMQANI